MIPKTAVYVLRTYYLYDVAAQPFYSETDRNDKYHSASHEREPQQDAYYTTTSCTCIQYTCLHVCMHACMHACAVWYSAFSNARRTCRGRQCKKKERKKRRPAEVARDTLSSSNNKNAPRHPEPGGKRGGGGTGTWPGPNESRWHDHRFFLLLFSFIGNWLGLGRNLSIIYV